jgi:hypothetical protein
MSCAALAVLLAFLTLPACRTTTNNDVAAPGGARDELPSNSSAAGKEATWCAAVPELTSDGSADRTGQSNDSARARTVMSAIEWQLFRCDGVLDVGVTIVEIAEALARGRPIALPTREVAATDPIFVIKVSLREAKNLPPTSPLFVQGVRVYFEVTGDIVPL